MYYNPVRIGLRYPHLQFPLLDFPPIPYGHRAEEPDDLMMMRWECCPIHRQQQLARIMGCPSLGTEMIIQVLYDGFYPREPDLDEY